MKNTQLYIDVSGAIENDSFPLTGLYVDAGFTDAWDGGDLWYSISDVSGANGVISVQINNQRHIISGELAPEATTTPQLLQPRQQLLQPRQQLLQPRQQLLQPRQQLLQPRQQLLQPRQQLLQPRQQLLQPRQQLQQALFLLLVMLLIGISQNGMQIIVL